MQPLVFLTVRTLFNGVRRALTSPQRLIGLAVLGFYWFNFVFRNLLSSPGTRRARALEGMGSMALPSASVIESAIFAGFLILSFFMVMSVATPRGGFRPADIDVLFPTPIDPKLVLMFRIVRDVLVTLLLPLLMAIVGRPIAIPLDGFFRNFPTESGLLGKAITVTVLLFVMAWTTIGYALSLFVNRSDERSDRNRKAINIALTVLVVGVSTLVALRLRADPTWATAEALTHEPLLRIAFFPASFASAAVMAPYVGELSFALLGFGGLIGVIAAATAVAMTQVGYLYDQAAAKGFAGAAIRSLQQQGDTYGIFAEQARRGRVRKGWIAGRVGNLVARGGLALVWKEVLLMMRGAMWQLVLLLPLIAFVMLLPIWAGRETMPLVVARGLLLGTAAFGAFMLTLQTATSGFIELLKRVDLLKPLPFTSSATVFWEMVPKAIPSFVSALIAGIAACYFEPRLWDFALGLPFLATGLSLVIAAVVLLVTVLFPDVDDGTQRSFRGLLMLIGTASGILPVGLVVAGLMFINANGIVVGLVGAVASVAIAIGLSAVAGRLYSSFNPSE